MKIPFISKLPTGIPLQINTSTMDYCNHAFMCIKQEGSSEYSVPDNLQFLVQEILSGIYDLSEYLYNNDYRYNCYLSIKHEYVHGGSIGNRPGWHIDGFKSDQHNFIWYDCIPTEVCTGSFNLTNDHDISLDEMDYQAIDNDKFNHALPINTLYEMNQECVHRPTYNKMDKAVLRTFIKITYSKEQFNCIGNAWNYKLPHIRMTAHRNNHRNHSVL